MKEKRKENENKNKKNDLPPANDPSSNDFVALQLLMAVYYSIMRIFCILEVQINLKRMKK